MKKKNSSNFLLKAAWVAFFVAIVAICIMLSSFSTRSTRKMTDDIWKMLGITRQTGDESIQTSFMNGYLYYYGVKNIKNIALNDRGAIAKDLLNYTKEFISAASFKKQYDDIRKNAKPSEPELTPLRSIEQIQKDEIAKTEKSIKDTEKTMKELPDLAKSMQPILEMFKKNLKEYQDPKNPAFASIAMGEQYDRENRLKSYKERTANWEASYPENVNAFISTRLQKMLDATKGIDYDAQLVEKNGKKKFVNQAYEYKNTEWKQGFRAGKEVTETARVFVQKWLGEITNKK